MRVIHLNTLSEASRLVIGFIVSLVIVRAVAGTSHQIYSFQSLTEPSGALLEVRDGSFYGTSLAGGNNGQGLIFRATTNGQCTVVASFDVTNGSSPQNADLIQGTDGAFYGTTAYGGTENYGTVFRLTGDDLRPLVSFNFINGAHPRAGLVEGRDGALYGTTLEGDLPIRGRFSK